MKKFVFPLLLSVLILLSACGGQSASPPTPARDETLRILATTYPVYLFTTAVTEGVEGVQVTQLVNQQTSCLHDYTLTVHDMKAIEAADVIIMNGAGLEDFMADALAASDAAVIDCSQGVELLLSLEHKGHDGHDHDEAYDPHIWMDPDRAVQMLQNVGAGLARLDGANAADYQANAAAAAELLNGGDEGFAAVQLAALATAHSSLSSVTEHLRLITFHDGFQYFAEAFGLELLRAIEEEEGAEASAAEIKEIVSLIGAYGLPAIYTEKNGSEATAQAISRETGCAVYPLDMIMSGDGTGLQPYLEAMTHNLQVVAYGAEALS